MVTFNAYSVTVSTLSVKEHCMNFMHETIPNTQPIQSKLSSKIKGSSTSTAKEADYSCTTLVKTATREAIA